MTTTTGYILSTEVKGLAYYAQRDSYGNFRLNGLSDNAFVFLSREEAEQAKGKPFISKYRMIIIPVEKK